MDHKLLIPVVPMLYAGTRTAWLVRGLSFENTVVFFDFCFGIGLIITSLIMLVLWAVGVKLTSSSE